MFDDSEKVFEVGRDCHWRVPVNHKTTRKRRAGGIRTGGTISNLYSSLDVEDDLCRLGVWSALIEGTRGLSVWLAAAFVW